MAAGAGVPQDGAGTTLSLGTSTWDTTALVSAITIDSGVTRAPLETTNLVTSVARTFIPEDLVDNGGFTCEVIFHDFITVNTLISAAAETIIINYQLEPTQSTAALITGSGFLVGYDPPEAAVGELLKCKAKFKWTGVVTYTAST